MNPDKDQPQYVISDTRNNNNPTEMKSITYHSATQLWDTLEFKFNYNYDSNNYPVKRIRNTYINHDMVSDTTLYQLYCD